VPRYWPASQRDLFLLLLEKQATGVTRTATLCNLVVALWIFQGDYAVPLRQARRALKTWADQTERSGWERSKYSADRLLGRLAPGVRRADLEDVSNMIAHVAWSGTFDPKAMTNKLREVCGAENELEQGGAIHHLSDNYVGQIDAQLHARRHLKQVPDELFRFARTELRATSERYSAIQPHLASDPQFGRFADPLTHESLVSFACARLTLMLGLLLQAGDKPNPAIVQAS
jgi:hypothetical protein